MECFSFGRDLGRRTLDQQRSWGVFLDLFSMFSRREIRALVLSRRTVTSVKCTRRRSLWRVRRKRGIGLLWKNLRIKRCLACSVLSMERAPNAFQVLLL